MELLPPELQRRIFDEFLSFQCPYTRKLCLFREYFYSTTLLTRSQRAKVRVILSPHLKERDLSTIKRAYRFLCRLQKLQPYWRSTMVNNHSIALYLANQLFGPFKTPLQEAKSAARVQTGCQHVGVWIPRNGLRRGLPPIIYFLTFDAAAGRIKDAYRKYWLRNESRKLELLMFQYQSLISDQYQAMMDDL